MSIEPRIARLEASQMPDPDDPYRLADFTRSEHIALAITFTEAIAHDPRFPAEERKAAAAEVRDLWVSLERHQHHEAAVDERKIRAAVDRICEVHQQRRASEADRSS